jgi:glycosyltransferase involved in cell wall biosynthesis
VTERRILFLDHTAALGGAELCLLDVAPRFAATSVVVLMEDGPLRGALEQRGVAVTVLERGASLQKVRRESRAPGLAVLSAVAGIAQEVARLSRSYDLVYANSQKAFIVACASAAFARRPVLWHLHDILDPHVFSRINIGVDVFLANHVASGVIANSQATASALVARGGTRARIDVIYNGIDSAAIDAVRPEDVAAARAALDFEDAPVLGLFGRLAPWKGQDVAIRALSLLGAESPVQLAIVGEALFGEKSYAQQIRALVSELGLERRVRFLGFRNDVPVLMRAVDVLVHTSVAPEPFGRVIAEGMLAERPVIATSGGGASEIVTAGVTAWQVPPNDPAALAAAITDVLRDPVRARAVAAKGRCDALQRFTLASTLPLTEHAIERAVEGRV